MKNLEFEARGSSGVAFSGGVEGFLEGARRLELQTSVSCLARFAARDGGGGFKGFRPTRQPQILEGVKIQKCSLMFCT